MKRRFFIPTMLLSAFLIQTSCSVKMQEKSPSSITVSGIGTVFSAPDVAGITIECAHTAPTTTEAKKGVEANIAKIQQILHQQNIDKKDIRTISLNYRVEYNYNNGNRIKIGQRAEQTVLITVKNLINAPERLSMILDKIATNDQIEVQNIYFDIENKEEFFKKSRELAYQKALNKAQEYAQLSGRKLGKTLTISENISQNIAQPRLLKSSLISDSNSFSSAESLIPTGEQGITSEVVVVFSLE